MLGEKACQAHGHNGQGIVEKHLHRVENEGVLQDIDKSVKKACHGSHSRAEAPGNEQQGHHGAKGNIASLGQVEDAELLQDDGEGQHQGHIHQHPYAQLDFTNIEAAA